jgi:hypothetical protein
MLVMTMSLAILATAECSILLSIGRESRYSSGNNRAARAVALVATFIGGSPSDGLKAAEMLVKMAGWNEPEQVKHDHVHLQVDSALIEQLRAGYAVLVARESGKDALEGAPAGATQMIFAARHGATGHSSAWLGSVGLGAVRPGLTSAKKPFHEQPIIACPPLKTKILLVLLLTSTSWFKRISSKSTTRGFRRIKGK